MTKQSLRLLRRHEVEGIVGFSRSTMYAMIKDGTFPAPLRIGQRAVAWPESSICEWIASRSTTRPTGGAGA